MKKFLSTLLALVMLLSCAALAEDAVHEVYVSISDGTGGLAVAYAPVAVTDADADGALTIYDALLASHIAYHPDGAGAFLAEKTEWGMSMYRLWGVENGGSYGYCINDASAMSLLDPVQVGDHVKAYAYSDLTAWSDTYCYFNAPLAEVAVNTEVPLTLFGSAYDENWAPITLPVSGATLVVNGVMTEVVTDENGNAVLAFAEAGQYIVSAASKTQTLVPPVCIVIVAE